MGFLSPIRLLTHTKENSSDHGQDQVLEDDQLLTAREFEKPGNEPLTSRCFIVSGSLPGS